MFSFVKFFPSTLVLPHLYFSDWKGQLKADFVVTQKAAFATGTIKNFKSQWNKFACFCQYMGDELLPISQSDLCLYIQFLSRSLKSPQSILNYVNGLRVLHKFLGLQFPARDEFLVRLTMKGVARILNHVPNRASPITPDILRRIGNCLELESPLHSVVFCLFLFMFFLFARRAQFVPDSLSEVELHGLVARSHVQVSLGGLFVTFFKTSNEHCT